MSIKLLDLLFEDKTQDTIDDVLSQSQDIEPDSVIQMFIKKSKEQQQEPKENLRLSEVRKNRSNVRIKSGSEAQQKVLSFIKNNPDFKQLFKSKTNVPGSQKDDIVLVGTQDKKPVSMEVKSVNDFNGLIYFFDKSISPMRSGVTPSFFNLLRGVVIKRLGLSEDWYQKADSSSPKSPDLVQAYELVKKISEENPVKKTSEEKPKPVEQNLTQEIKNCIEFASVPMKIRKMIKGGKNLPWGFVFGKNIIFSSHDYDKNAMGFKPNPEDSQNLEKTVVYLQRNTNEGIKFSSVLCSYNQENNLFVPEKIVETNKLSERPLSTSGFVNVRDCLSYPLEKGKVENDNESLKVLTYNVIIEKYKNNNYFAVVSGNEVRIIHLKGEDPLNLKGAFGPNNIEYVGFNTAGRAGEGGIRLKLECKINYDNFVSFTIP